MTGRHGRRHDHTVRTAGAGWVAASTSSPPTVRAPVHELARDEREDRGARGPHIGLASISSRTPSACSGA